MHTCRPPRDLKDTLLHEMIHAELFLKGVRDDGDHGKVFRCALDRIKEDGGGAGGILQVRGCMGFMVKKLQPGVCM
jgi:hypothetical protein